MKNGRIWILLGVTGAVLITAVILFVTLFSGQMVHSTVSYQLDAGGQALEQISEEATPLAGESFPADSVAGTVIRLMSEARPVATQTEPVDEHSPEEELPDQEDPEEPAGSVKPEDTSDVAAMAKYIYETACTFWEGEKELSGSTTREVATRVASFIGSGTFVDCAGGDATRTDSNGNTHEGYAIADDYRDYIDEPELTNFKIYLSDKDYTESVYGARESVTGVYYKSGAESATYTPED